MSELDRPVTDAELAMLIEASYKAVKATDEELGENASDAADTRRYALMSLTSLLELQRRRYRDVVDQKMWKMLHTVVDIAIDHMEQVHSFMQLITNPLVSITMKEREKHYPHEPDSKETQWQPAAELLDVAKDILGQYAKRKEIMTNVKAKVMSEIDNSLHHEPTSGDKPS